MVIVDPSLFTLPYDRRLIQGIRQAGHHVTLYGRTPKFEDGDFSGIDIVPHFYRSANSDLGLHLPNKARLGLKGLDHTLSMLRLGAALRPFRPDVIHFQWLNLPLIDKYVLDGLRRVAPLVLTVHDTNPFNGDPSAGVQTKGFFSALRKFDRLIVHTEQGKQRLAGAGIHTGKLAVLPHGPLFALPCLNTPDPMDGFITFVLFGKIKPYKGVDILIDAFAMLPPELKHKAAIRVVGKPYMELKPIQDQATRLGIDNKLIIEPRFVADDEIPALFGRGTVAMFPYREIEASGVLSIALAHARPVIASNIGNFSETIADGVQGHLVLPGDPAALCGAMTHVLKDRNFARQCSLEARRSAEAIPEWDEIGAATAELYREIAS